MRRLIGSGLNGKASEGKALERPSEPILWMGKPTVLAFYDALAGGALLIIVSALVSMLLPFIALLSAIGVVCGLLLIAFAFIKAWANTYIVTDKCVKRQYRFVAIRVEEAAFDKITDIVVEQDVVGRVLGFGDIRFDTAGTPFMGVLFKGLKHPAEVKRLVDERLRR